MNSRIRWPRLAAMLAALALLVTACGDGEDEQADPADAPAEDGDSYNDADVTFLQGMIPHHEQAVEMAQMVPERTDRSELLTLAEEIITSQQAEIDRMQAMLADAGQADDHDERHHDEADMGEDEGQAMDGMDEMDGMGGMMTPEQMAELETRQGVEFDLMFVDMMIEHHQGAIDSAEQVIRDGQHSEVRALAEEIITAQQAEIDQMNAWRAEWAGAS